MSELARTSRRSRKAREVGRRDALVLALLDVQHADRIRALPAAEARAAENRQRLAAVRQPDAAREEQPHVLDLVGAAARRSCRRRRRCRRVAELRRCPEFSRKKSRFSGKEQVEARQVDLLLVGLDLREVGVDREVPHEPAT